jgi:hypothetical protein
MITHSPRVRVLALSLVAAAFSLTALHAQPTIYADAVGDISTNLPTAGGTLDIVKMEVSDTTNDVIFALTVNGNITSPNWGNFMIGIATGSTTNTSTGNGWNRPINLNTAANGGMTRWIGSWVNGGTNLNTVQFWTYTPGSGSGGTGTNWSGPQGIPVFSYAANTNGTSTINYTVSKASLGTTNLGDVISFDAYSSGSGNGDTAIDALSNPNIAVTSWGQAYTSSVTTGLSTYTLANSASLITNTVTFTVDMNVQESIGAFDPFFDVVTVGGDWNGFVGGDTAYELGEVGMSGVYEGTFAIAGPSGTAVPYKFAINTNLETSGNRTFGVGTDPAPPPLVLPSVFYNNNPGFRDVTFSVDMTVQETLGNYNGTNDVLVVGAFNNWDTNGVSSNVLTPGTNGVFSGTISIGGEPATSVAYKFFSAGMPNSGYENDPNRQLVLPPVGQATNLPVVFWNNLNAPPQSRGVTFSVDMSVQVQNGNFNTNTGVVRVIGNFNDLNYDTGNTNYNLTNVGADIYEGIFAIQGDQATSVQYKFFSPGFPVNNGYEIVNPNDLFENRTFVLGTNAVPQALPLVFWSNDDGGSTFASWSGGAPLTPELQLRYAIGGAASPSAQGVLPVTTVTPSLLSVTAIVRIDDPALTVIGETTDDLSVGPWTSVGVTTAGAAQGVDQTGVPAGTERLVYSVVRSVETKKFLRIRTVLAIP